MESVRNVVMKYKCKICGGITEIDTLDDIHTCKNCGVDKSFLEQVDDVVVEKVYKKIEGPIPIEDDNPGIMRIDEKCIKCGRCAVVCQEQVGIRYNLETAKSPVCLSCGQCILNCPVGAIVPKYCYKKVMDYIKDTDKVVIAFTSPAVRVALGEAFNSHDVNVEGKMVASLKKIGFDYVFDTTFGADLTIMEEASELIERIKNNERLPQFTSCCPAWVRYMEIYHSNLTKYLSTCKSPIGMQGAIIKSYFSEMMEIPKEKIISVAITPCTAKKKEITRLENQEIDFVVTTSELTLMIQENNIDFINLENQEFDTIMGRGSGAGVIFGNTGGVTEAAIRTAYHFLTGKSTDKKLLHYTPVRGYDHVKEASIHILDKELKLLVIHGLTNVEPYLKQLENNELDYDFIEVMNCPGGCVGGGGQPLGIVSKQKEIIEKRISGLYSEDNELKVRNSYENCDIIDLYKSYLQNPLSEKAKELLHTKYNDESGILGE